MSAQLRVFLRGLNVLQKANLELIKATDPRGKLGEVIKAVLVDVHRHAVYNTPWDTTTLRKSHRMEFTASGKTAQGRIFIDPSVTRPWDGKRPAEYGAQLHEQGMVPGVRGGIRAFYQYTVEQDAPQIVSNAVTRIYRALP